MWVQSLGWEDPLEKEMTTYFSILAWRIPWTEEPGRLQSMGLQTVGHNLAAEQQQQGCYDHLHCVDKGNEVRTGQEAGSSQK